MLSPARHQPARLNTREEQTGRAARVSPSAASHPQVCRSQPLASRRSYIGGSSEDAQRRLINSFSTLRTEVLDPEFLTVRAIGKSRCGTRRSPCIECCTLNGQQIAWPSSLRPTFCPRCARLRLRRAAAPGGEHRGLAARQTPLYVRWRNRAMVGFTTSGCVTGAMCPSSIELDHLHVAAGRASESRATARDGQGRTLSRPCRGPGYPSPANASNRRRLAHQRVATSRGCCGSLRRWAPGAARAWRRRCPALHPEVDEVLRRAIGGVARVEGAHRRGRRRRRFRPRRWAAASPRPPSANSAGLVEHHRPHSRCGAQAAAIECHRRAVRVRRRG